jgi:hypothetical protein
MHSLRVSSEQGRTRANARAALTARVAEQVRAWSGVPLLGLGCVIGYRATAAGAGIAGLVLGASIAGLGAIRIYYLLRHLRLGNPR